MTGLLLKDFYTLLRYCRYYLLMIGVFIVAAPWVENNSFFLYYPILMAALCCVTLLSYDERENWAEYAELLPVTRGQVVSSKYMVNLLFVAAILPLQALVLGVKALLRPETAAGLGDVVLSIAGFSGGALCMSALFLPLLFRFGTEKGRVLFLAIGALAGGGTAVMLSISGGELSGLLDRVFGNAAMGGALVLGVIAAVYSGSWWLSIRLYEARMRRK